MLIVINGRVSANSELNHKTPNNPIPSTLSSSQKNVALKRWEASPDGIRFKKWEASSTGIQVQNSILKISKSISDFSNLEGVVTSSTLPQGSRLGYGVMIKIHGADYILAFGLDNNNEFESLHSLKVNDKIIIRSHSVSRAPKYAYPIVAGDYVKRDDKIIYKRAPKKGGC